MKRINLFGSLLFISVSFCVQATEIETYQLNNAVTKKKLTLRSLMSKHEKAIKITAGIIGIGGLGFAGYIMYPWQKEVPQIAPETKSLNEPAKNIPEEDQQPDPVENEPAKNIPTKNIPEEDQQPDPETKSSIKPEECISPIVRLLAKNRVDYCQGKITREEYRIPTDF